MFPFPKLWGCKYTDNILIINNFINKLIKEADYYCRDRWRIEVILLYLNLSHT